MKTFDRVWDTIVPAVSFTYSVVYHKFFIALYGRRVGLPWKRLLKHDWSKFRPMIFWPYAMHFANRKGLLRGSYNQQMIQDEFSSAWDVHSHIEPHHIQFHEHQLDDQLIHMEDLKEMIVDWCSATRVYGGKKPPRMLTDWEWYKGNYKRFQNSYVMRGKDLDVITQGVLYKVWRR